MFVPRIDEFLSDHDFSASYETRVNAPGPVVYERLLGLDLSELWLVRLLMTVRSGSRLPHRRVPADLRQRLQGTGFVMLAEDPGEELVVGVAGQFWRPDGGRCSRPGYAKSGLELHVASRFAKERSSFNRDEDQVFRTIRAVEIPNLLESSRSILGPDPQGYAQTGEDRSGINLQSGFPKVTKYRKSSSAILLSRLLTACNAPQRARS